MSAPRLPRTQNLAVVSIDHECYLLPTEKALKLVQLLQGAIGVRRDWDRPHNFRYQIGQQPEVELTMVRPDQLVKRADPQSDEGPRHLESGRG